MEFGVSLPNFGHLASVTNMRQVAQVADSLGFDSLWAAERLLVPIPPNQSWSRRNPTAFEPMVTLANMAAVTESVRLCTSVVILPVRNPVLLARMAASLDVLSGGRLELGLGVGWMREEMEISNVSYGKRGRITDEYIRVLRSVWSAQPHDGDYVKVPPHLFEPKPLRGRIPIWIGGNSDAALRRAAQLGDGWIPMGELAPDEIARGAEKMRMWAGDGREARIACSVGIDDGSLEQTGRLSQLLEEYSSAGASQVIARFDEDVPVRLHMMERFAEEIMKSFR